MPLVAILFGAVLIDLAFRGTEYEFATQLEQDFGGGEFWTWVAAIWIIGALGSVQGLRGISNWALALVIVVLILTNGGFFSQAEALITNLPPASATVPLSSYSNPQGSSSSSSSSGGGGGLAGLFGGGSGGSAAGSAVEDVAIAALA